MTDESKVARYNGLSQKAAELVRAVDAVCCDEGNPEVEEHAKEAVDRLRAGFSALEQAYVAARRAHLLSE